MKIIVDLCNQHYGSIHELKRMSLNAFLSGADAVKIQLIDSEKHFGNSDRKYRDISYEETYELYNYCNLIGVEFMASVFDKERLGWIKHMDISTHKIASRTVKEDPELCDMILNLNKPTLVSTGFCGFGEFPFGHDSNIDYLFCVSKYPTLLHDTDLAKMPHFKESGYVGYSDHSIGYAAAVRAKVRGAKVLEKHFSNNIRSQNKFEGGHLGSFDSESLKQFRNLCKELDILEEHSER